MTKATSCPGDHSTKVLVNEDGPMIYRLYSVNSHIMVMIHDDISDLTSVAWKRERHDTHHRERKTRRSEWEKLRIVVVWEGPCAYDRSRALPNTDVPVTA